MAEFTRKNAWNNNGTFDNADLFWYAKGVSVMQSRPLNDPTSWWFFAAMHGEYIDGAGQTPPGSLNWKNIPPLPNVPTNPLPSSSLIQRYWDQCQHSSWFFAPWHRGYLFAIENILREIIISLGGPPDWALPYWNYFGPNEQFRIPPAFTLKILSDGSPNPLYVTARYGPPNGHGQIFVDVSKVSQKCQNNTDYTGVTPDYYGGGRKGFMHFGNAPGALEYNPHNGVHGMIGGRIPANMGLMSDPGTAGLDPIFYLHHCNIDRMWAAWNNAGKKNPANTDWLNGPTATADRKFFMPLPNGSPWQFTPAMVDDISELHYTYEDLTLGAPLAPLSRNEIRLLNFGLSSESIKKIAKMEIDANTELIGANSGVVELAASGIRTTVKFDSKGLNTVFNSISNMREKSILNREDASDLQPPDEVYLELEGIKGNADANEYSLTVNNQFVGHIFLFGLSKASLKDSEHGGEGLNIVFNISNIIDKIHLSDSGDVNSLDVLIQPSAPAFESDKCTIDRISVYRKGQ